MTTVPEGLGPDQPDSDTLLRRVVDVIGNAKSMPLSSSVMISRDEVLELLEEAITRFPEQLRQARWLLKEREEFLAKVQAEALQAALLELGGAPTGGKERLPNFATCTFADRRGEDMLLALDLAGVAASSGSACG